MADFNPSQTLPNSNQERISVNELQRNLEEARQQAEQLANRASNVWRKLHPEDTIKTKVYETSDFLDKNHCVFLPPEVQEMFEEYEKMQQEKRENPPPSIEDLQKAAEKNNQSVIPEDKVKKNPVFDKLMASFGLSKVAGQKTVQHTVNGMKITFEFPSSLITNFALYYAQSQTFGSFDFAFGRQVMQIAMSIVEIDDVPITKVLNLTDEYEHYSQIPTRIRKICGVKMAEFLNSIGDKDLEKFMSVYEKEIGFETDTSAPINAKEFVEVKCPKCGRTEIVIVGEDSKLPDRFCRDDGEKMEAQSSDKTDENSPLE